jgi:hypothetical protein
LTIFNFASFQAKFLNWFQEEQEQQQQHIDCMDLAIKKTLLKPRFFRSTHAGQKISNFPLKMLKIRVEI